MQGCWGGTAPGALEETRKVLLVTGDLERSGGVKWGVEGRGSPLAKGRGVDGFCREVGMALRGCADAFCSVF